MLKAGGEAAYQYAICSHLYGYYTGNGLCPYILSTMYEVQMDLFMPEHAGTANYY